MLIIPEEVEIFVPTLTALGMRDQDLIRRFRDTALRELNREIDKLFHPYFEDPDKCLQAAFLDTYAHQAVDPSNMLSGRHQKLFQIPLAAVGLTQPRTRYDEALRAKQIF
ncbi:MAG: hypothetical protein J7K49_02270 [Thaumarchaeota archaeon]|nr:hypothetical protein [Nitrososphaerota archaeon]